MQTMNASNPEDFVTKMITTTTTTVSTTTTTQQLAEGPRFENLRGAVGTQSRGGVPSVPPAGYDGGAVQRGARGWAGEREQEEPFIATFGVPRTIVPKQVAEHFPSASGYFPSTLQRDQKIPIEEEERTRFDVLHARRAALAPYDENRHAEAEARHYDLVRGAQRALHEEDMQRRAKVLRATSSSGWSASRECPPAAFRSSRQRSLAPDDDAVVVGAKAGRKADSLFYDVPIEVVPSENAAGFPHTRRYFDAEGLDSYNKEQRAMPVSEEERIRFVPLAARRAALAPVDAKHHREADRRRTAETEGRVAALREKDAERARRASNADRSGSMLPRGAPIPNDGEFPWSGAGSFVHVSNTPDVVRCSEVERHFRNASAAMAEHGGPNPNAGRAVPLAEEERTRFSRVAARRAAEAARDEAQHERAEANRAEQLESRVMALKSYDARRDAVHQRVRERASSIDSASRERMATAEERRRAILAARVANLRDVAVEREARGKQALDERRMAEHGFVPPHADVTVVAARPVYAQRSASAPAPTMIASYAPAAATSTSSVRRERESEWAAAPSTVDVDVKVLSASGGAGGPSRVHVHTSGEEPPEVVVHPAMVARSHRDGGDSEWAEKQQSEQRPAREAHAIAAPVPVAPVSSSEAVVSSAAPQSSSAPADAQEGSSGNKSRSLVNEPAPRERKAKSSRFCC